MAYSSKIRTAYNFIAEPDPNLKCAVCLELASQPKQCEDCGKLFCSECIEKNKKKPCPNCRTDNPKYFKDVKSKLYNILCRVCNLSDLISGRRDIDELQVRCANTEKGCPWSGTVGTLDGHILATCQFALVPCPKNCGEDKGAGVFLLVRKDLDKHLKTKCPKRAYECVYCGKEGTFAGITEGHEKICEKKTIACPNKGSGSSLNTEKGCQWTGTVGTLDGHIASCQFALVPCPNKCEEDKGAGVLLLIRKLLDEHLKTKCPQRADECPHCGEKGTFTSITEDHDKVCEKKIVACPNKGSGCSLSTEQGRIKEHVSSDCKFAEVACVYESLGCGLRMLRKDIVEHQENEDKAHLHLMFKSFSLLKEQHETLLAQHDMLLEQHDTLLEQHRAPSEGEAVIFQLLGYTSKKKKGEGLSAKPFYSHPGGYKMLLLIYLNGFKAAEGSHVSVFIALSEGRYDDQLLWPFLGTVTVELLNQLEDKNHHRLVLVHDAKYDTRVGSSAGHSMFVPHSSLGHKPTTNTQYLLDDTLYFRVSVTVDSYKPWLVSTHLSS